MTIPANSAACESRSVHRQRGMTLVEIMISLTLGLIILAGMTSLFISQNRTQSKLDKAGRMIENGRYALQVIADDLQLAGYYGELNINTAVFPTPGALPDPCSAAVADLGAAIPVHVQGVNNVDEGTAVRPTCFQDNSIVAGGVPVVQGTDILVVRRTSTTTTAVSSILPAGGNTRYLQSSLCASDAAPQYVVHTNQGQFVYRQRDCATGVPAAVPARRFLVRIYFISPFNRYEDDDVTPADDIPTLKYAELDAGGDFSIVPMVEGIENMQISYHRDTDTDLPNPDGIPETVDNCATCTANDWSRVVGADVHLLARNVEETKGFAGEGKRFDLGDVTVGPFDDGYQRRVFSEYVRNTNVAGRWEVP